MNPREVEGQLDDKLGAFELCSYTMETYPQEKITFAKFLDDNDPSLLLLVTYDEQTSTSYMKVMKIQRIIDAQSKPASNGRNDLTTSNRNDNILNSHQPQQDISHFLNLDEVPFTNLKGQLKAKQDDPD